MNKSLLFCYSKVRQKDGKELETWELFNAGGVSPIVHAMWDPLKLELICQYNFHKENLVDYPTMSKSGKINSQERKLDQYFIFVIKDHNAIQHLLDNFVSNYNGQNWLIEHQQTKVNVAQVAEEEYEQADISEKIEQ